MAQKNQSLRNQLEIGGTPLSVMDSATPSTPNFKESKLHYTYSINDIPIMPKKPSPSELDLNGTTPANNYRSNAPQGSQSF